MIARKQFLKLLENIGFLNKAQIDRAIKEHSMGSRSIRSVLLDLKYLGGEESSAALMPQLGLVPTPINITNLPASLVEKVPSNFAREHRVVPLRMDGTTLILATDEPLNILVEENLADNLNVKDVRLEITTTESLNNSLLNAYSLTNEDLRPLLEKVDKGYTGELDMDNPALTVKSGVDGETEEALQAPVIRLANAVIVDALRRRASDIHVEPMEDRFRIRYRIDGVLHENINPPRNLQNPLLARFKIMAGMDLAEKRLPQDGRIMINAAGRPIDLRVSSLPGIYGESLVMRILDKTSMLLSMDQLGFLEDDQQKWAELLKYSGGIVLVTGPTGSGKTTTLYTSLSALNTTDVKIMTVEEPVEYQIEGINQTPVRTDIGLTFGRILRSFLRQAPDIILVGEIRDFETADIALRAALTGHLVFSTLHTNDATGSPTRLVDLGAAPFLVASSLQGVLAQRLVRTLCKHCKIPDQPTDEERILLNIKENEEVTLCRPGGCDQCNNTGFRGRMGIMEIFTMDDTLRQMVLHKETSSDIRRVAREHGMRTMGEDGLLKVKRGLTTYEEVINATVLD
ncbi:MAG TPA: ATPase, T2SS/T4P/T4SS family [bacterium]|nr:ATPase, T2SS/T4P/T4SS family [bacterium]